MSDRWATWIMKALLAAGAAFGVGMLTLGLPGAFFLETILGPSPAALPPDAAWPLSIMITQIGALTILPASLLLRVVMPKAVGWAHAGATALLTFVATLVFTAVLAGTLRVGLMHAREASTARGDSYRIRSAAFSPIMIVRALVPITSFNPASIAKKQGGAKEAAEDDRHERGR